MFFMLAFALACRSGPVPPPPLEPTSPPEVRASRNSPKLLASVNIYAVGDIMMHGMVKKSAEAAAGDDNHDGYDNLFREVAPFLQEADLVFGNLETPIAPKSDRGSGSMVFNAPLVLLDSLEEAGFDFVSFANNHVYDQGRSGFEETLKHLDASKLVWAGAGNTCAEAAKAKIIESKGIKIGFIAATDVYNNNLNEDEDKACSFKLDPEQVIKSSAEARDLGAEIVILSAHWGSEYHIQPSQRQVDLAHQMLDGGVDVILGHHPHVLQPLEVYKASDGRITFVIYSLGNFISNQSRWYVHNVNSLNSGNPRDSIALQFSIVRKEYKKAGIKTELASLKADPLWTMNNTHFAKSGEKPDIHPVLARSVLESILKAIDTETDPENLLLLEKQADLYQKRIFQVRNVVGQQLFPDSEPED